jgi:uncharacterized protein (DUF4415 family)
MPRELRPVNPRPLTESEEHTLRSLLDRSGQSLAAAEAQRARERDQERRLREKSDRLAAREAKLSKRLAELRIDIDVVSSQIYQIAPHATAFRHVSQRLQEFAELVPTQSYFNSQHDTVDRNFLMLLGEIALSMHEQASRPRGEPLRARMKGVGVDIGPDSPGGDGGSPDSPAAMAQRILAAAKKARPS